MTAPTTYHIGLRVEETKIAVGPSAPPIIPVLIVSFPFLLLMYFHNLEGDVNENKVFSNVILRKLAVGFPER